MDDFLELLNAVGQGVAALVVIAIFLGLPLYVLVDLVAN